MKNTGVVFFDQIRRTPVLYLLIKFVEQPYAAHKLDPVSTSSSIACGFMGVCLLLEIGWLIKKKDTHKPGIYRGLTMTAVSLWAA